MPAKRVAVVNIRNPKDVRSVDPRTAQTLVERLGRYRYAEMSAGAADVPVLQAAEVREPSPEPVPPPVEVPMEPEVQPEPASEPVSEPEPAGEPETEQDESEDDLEGVRLTRAGKPDRRYKRRDMEPETL